MTNQVPLLKQWNDKWGDYPFGSSTIAASGCGPTCFSMIAQYFGYKVTPPQAADFAIINNYFSPDVGTSWDFFPTAGEHFNVPMYQTSNPDEVLAALRNNIPCIGAHGPGEFTDFGHFIVYAYITVENQIMINDPNRDDTCKLYPWDFVVQDNANSGYIAFVPSLKIPSNLS